MEFIDLKAQYAHLKDKIDKNIEKVLNDSHYIMGEEVKELEEKLAKYEEMLNASKERLAKLKG